MSCLTLTRDAGGIRARPILSPSTLLPRLKGDHLGAEREGELLQKIGELAVERPLYAADDGIAGLKRKLR